MPLFSVTSTFGRAALWSGAVIGSLTRRVRVSYFSSTAAVRVPEVVGGGVGSLPWPGMLFACVLHFEPLSKQVQGQRLDFCVFRCELASK